MNCLFRFQSFSDQESLSSPSPSHVMFICCALVMDYNLEDYQTVTGGLLVVADPL